MYFLLCFSEKALLCKDGSWAKKPVALEHPDRILALETAERASIMLLDLPCRSNVYVCSDKTLFQKLGIRDASLIFGQEDCPRPEQPCAGRPAAERERIVQQANQEAVVNTPLILDTTDILERLAVLIERWDAAINEYTGEMTGLDGRIQDELHFQEFEQLNCSQGYKAYKRLHELRIARRRCKNEYLIAKNARSLFRASSISEIQQALSAIEGLKALNYSPRACWPGDADG